MIPAFALWFALFAPHHRHHHPPIVVGTCQELGRCWHTPTVPR